LLTASISARTAASGEAKVRWVCGAPAATDTAAPMTTHASPAAKPPITRRIETACSMGAVLTTSRLYRRRPPPPPERELPRLSRPRELAARSDFPLEYPENASDFVPLRSAVDARCPLVSPLCPRDS